METQGKLEQKLGLERTLAVEYIEVIKQIATVINPKTVVDEIQADADDNRILECAFEAGADIIISADKDLLRLKAFRGAKIFHLSDLKHLQVSRKRRLKETCHG